MVGHLFQNYDKIYTCGFLPRKLAIFSALWVFFPSMCPFSSHASVDSVSRKHALSKHAYICAQHEHIYMRYKQTNKHVRIYAYAYICLTSTSFIKCNAFYVICGAFYFRCTAFMIICGAVVVVCDIHLSLFAVLLSLYAVLLLLYAVL